MENKVNVSWIIKFVVAAFLTIALSVLGLYEFHYQWINHTFLGVILAVLSVLPIIWSILGYILALRFKKKITREHVEKSFMEHKSVARDTAKKKLILLKRLIAMGDILAIIIFVFGIIVAFSSTSVLSAAGIPLMFLAFVYIMAGLESMHARTPKINTKKDEFYISESEFPKIYSVAHRAAKCLGCDGKISICLSHDFNAGIMKISGGYSIMLGSYILDICSEEEIFNTLLHEFGHVTAENDDKNFVMYYMNKFSTYTSPTNKICLIPFIYLHVIYGYEYILYNFACSIINEEDADMAMKIHGDPKIAASLLTKLQFCHLYDWERGTYDEPCMFENKRMPENAVRLDLALFKERVNLRRDTWISMIDSEILARNATYPTIKMRIQALGVDRADVMDIQDSEEYRLEVESLISYLEKLFHKQHSKWYELNRPSRYTIPKEYIEAWENEGKKITVETYHDLLFYTKLVGKNEDFVNLCCQIIDEMPEPSNYYAHYMYGVHLLKLYDERGLDHLYKSIELNHNMWESSVDTIGRYCCISGKQDRLDEYRARAKELITEQDEFYDHTLNLLRKDKVVEECLPDGMTEQIVDYIKSLGGRCIEKVYIVRKLIGDERFVSCVVVKPYKTVDETLFNSEMEKIFQHLDKAYSWQFSLFDFRYVPKNKVTKVKNSLIFDRFAKKSLKN